MKAICPRLLVALALMLLAAACGGDDGPSSPTPVGGGTPGPEEPRLGEGVFRLAEGTFSVALVPSAVSGFDPIDLPLEGDAEPPPCGAFVFNFTWQVGETDEGAGTGLVWRLTDGETTTDIGSGPSGSASVGCGFIEAQNTGGERVSVNVRYLIGRLPE